MNKTETEGETMKTAKEIWSEIRGKAHFYKTAKWQGEYVAIESIANPALGIFRIRTIAGTFHFVGCEFLTDYCF